MRPETGGPVNVGAVRTAPAARLLLLAPPGAGKSTQGHLLGVVLRVPHISTGEVMRAEILAASDLGRRVERYVTAGELVPDEVVVDMVIRRLTQPVPVGEFVLDGFPRTLVQAERAYEWALERDRTLFAVVHLRVPEEELVRRAAARAVSAGRVDDDEATFHRRLDAYRHETEPLLSFYRERGILLDVDGSGDVEVVHEEIVRALAGRGLQVRPA